MLNRYYNPHGDCLRIIIIVKGAPSGREWPCSWFRYGPIRTTLHTAEANIRIIEGEYKIVVRFIIEIRARSDFRWGT